VVEAVAQTGKELQSAYRETGNGGLAKKGSRLNKTEEGSY